MAISGNYRYFKLLEVKDSTSWEEQVAGNNTKTLEGHKEGLIVNYVL